MLKNTIRTETEIKKEITEYFRSRGYTVHRMNTGKVKSNRGSWLELCETGTPDLLVLGPYAFIMWIEVKKPGEKTTPEQLEVLAKYKSWGYKTVIASSLREVLDYLMPV